MADTQIFLTEYHFDSIEELLDAVAPWKDSIGLNGYIFRGHSKEHYQLIPSALRDPEHFWNHIPSQRPVQPSTAWDRDFWQVRAEYQLLREFYRLADQQGIPVPASDRIRKNMEMDWEPLGGVDIFTQSEWLPKDLAEVAALAQHYGIPTRLLDWTFDFYVALFFALSGVNDNEGNVKIWCLNKEYLSQLKNSEKRSPIEFVVPHYADNSNILGQQGLFTHWPTTLDPQLDIRRFQTEGRQTQVNRLALDTQLKRHMEQSEDSSNIIKTMTLPRSEASKGMHILRRLGYGHARLFPGLKGVAQQVLASKG